MAKVIIVSGPPASGKSELARWLSIQTGLPVRSKDAIKEDLFDQYAGVDRPQSRQLGEISFDTLIGQCKEMIASDKSFILESAFRSKDGELLATLFKDYKIIHASCKLSNETAARRFHDRARDGSRQRGHGDRNNSAELSSMLSENIFDVEIQGAESLHMPTDNFSSSEFIDARNNVLQAYAN